MSFSAVLLVLILSGSAAFFLWKEKRKEKQRAVDRYIANRYHNNYEEETRPAPTQHRRIRKDILDLMEEYGDLIACLVFVGRADGRLLENECEVIRDIVDKFPGYKNFPWHEFTVGFKDIKIQPELFESLVKKLAADKNKFAILRTGAKQIIGTQKTVQAGELYCLDFINSCAEKATESAVSQSREEADDEDRPRVYVIK